MACPRPFRRRPVPSRACRRLATRSSRRSSTGCRWRGSSFWMRCRSARSMPIPSSRGRLWQARHDAYWASLALRPGAKGISTDVCVPVSRLADCVTAAQEKTDEMDFIAPVVGHVGDGNFHVLLLIDMEDAGEVARAERFVGWLNELAISMGGTCTGEHGIGQGKAAYLERELGPEAMAVMAAIKAGIDPLNIFNPGKLRLPV